MYTFYPFWLLHTECLLILTIWSYCNVTKNCWGYSLGVNIMGPWSWWEQESQIYLDSWYPCGHSPIPSDYNMVEYFSNILHPFNLQIYNLTSFNQFFITPPPSKQQQNIYLVLSEHCGPWASCFGQGTGKRNFIFFGLMINKAFCHFIWTTKYCGEVGYHVQNLPFSAEFAGFCIILTLKL